MVAGSSATCAGSGRDTGFTDDNEQPASATPQTSKPLRYDKRIEHFPCDNRAKYKASGSIVYPIWEMTPFSELLPVTVFPGYDGARRRWPRETPEDPQVLDQRGF